MSLTLSFKNVYLKSTGNFAGPMESRGPLKGLFDEVGDDLYLKQNNFESCEMYMVHQAIEHCLRKAKMPKTRLNLLIGGDLMNQLMISNFVSKEYDTSFMGCYSACATIGLALIQGAMHVDKGIDDVLCFTSSHNACAERQFRYPLEYGVKRKTTTTFTATGAAAFLLTNEICGIQLKKATIGKVIDYEMTDQNDMGSCMAPAAYHSIIDHLNNTDTSFKDYDLIITGDLSSFGVSLLKRLLKESCIDDCGLHLYDLKTQQVFQGGSGCACSALVLSTFLYKQLKDKKLKRILFCPTGALLSATSTAQKRTIPTICHVLEFEVVL